MLDVFLATQVALKQFSVLLAEVEAVAADARSLVGDARVVLLAPLMATLSVEEEEPILPVRPPLVFSFFLAHALKISSGSSFFSFFFMRNCILTVASSYFVFACDVPAHHVG